MPNCCTNPTTSESTGKFFSKRSRSYARAFRKGKLEKIQRYLIDEIKKESLAGKTLLDIGSGVGKLHLTLLQNGAESAVGVDMSEEMLSQARSFAQNFGVESKVSYQQGDFVAIADSVSQADITMLDKVICCYEDLNGLIAASADKTKTLYALTFPANNLLTKFIFTAEIAISTLVRRGFRPYWHNWSIVTQLLEQRGFVLVSSTSQIMWQAALFKRL